MRGKYKAFFRGTLNCRGAACLARRCACDSYRLSIKTDTPVASVAAVTSQPLAALPPYGCGVPLAGCDRLRQLQVSTAAIQRRKASRFVIARRPVADVAISGRQLRFCREYLVIRPCSARLPRAQSAFAMTNLGALRHRIRAAIIASLHGAR